MRAGHLWRTSTGTLIDALAIALSAVAITGLFGAGVAGAAPPHGAVSFSAPSLFPSFGVNIYDYVVRCNDAPVTVQGHASGGWEEALGTKYAT